MPRRHRTSPSEIGQPSGRRWPAALLLALLAGCLPVRPAAAQEAWEYSPYRIQVWVAMQHAAPLTPGLLEEIGRVIQDRGYVEARSTWILETAAMPDAQLRTDMLHWLEELTPNDIFSRAGLSTVRFIEPGTTPQAEAEEDEEEDEEQEPPTPSPVADQLRPVLTEKDKVVLLAVRADSMGYELAGRELDVVTRQLGQVFTVRTRQRDAVPSMAFGIVRDSFRPLVQLDDVGYRDATGTIRAAGLIVDDFCPCRVDVNDVLVPVVRSNDRLGQPKELNGIRVAEWSYLSVVDPTEMEQFDADGDGKITLDEANSRRNDFLYLLNRFDRPETADGKPDQMLSREELASQDATEVTMKLHTALRNPIGGRSSSRTQKFGLRIRPHKEQSVLRFVTRSRQRPLSGYQVFSRHPVDETDAVDVGITNWNGEITVRPASTPLRLIYIKSGNSLLARVPVVPGFQTYATAELADDEARLQAEAFIRSVESTLADTYLQRIMLATRIDSALKEGKVDEASSALAEYRSLPTIAELTELLDRRKRDMSTSDRIMRRDIDQMFEKMRELIVERLNVDEEAELNSRINEARADA